MTLIGPLFGGWRFGIRPNLLPNIFHLNFQKKKLLFFSLFRSSECFSKSPKQLFRKNPFSVQGTGWSWDSAPENLPLAPQFLPIPPSTDPPWKCPVESFKGKSWVEINTMEAKKLIVWEKLIPWYNFFLENISYLIYLIPNKGVIYTI